MTGVRGCARVGAWQTSHVKKGVQGSKQAVWGPKKRRMSCWAQQQCWAHLATERFPLLGPKGKRQPTSPDPAEGCHISRPTGLPTYLPTPPNQPNTVSPTTGATAHL